jgi:predicted transcriptional regulator
MDLTLYLPIFEALGHESRLKVFAFIYRSRALGVRPKEMIDQFGLDSGTLDFHLKKLLAVGLISLKTPGSRGVYCVNESIPQELLQLFDVMNANSVLTVRSPLSMEQSKLGILH